MNWIRRIMNKLFIDNESFDIDEDDIDDYIVRWVR